MSERADYQPGVPCWVDTLGPDPDAAMRFYGELFGWEFVGPGDMPGDPAGTYFVARVRDRDVAGVGSQTDTGAPPTWNTHIAVANVDDAVQRASRSGAELVAGPVNAAPAGRLAALADPTGAVFCVWEPELREGAQLVNEPSAWAMSVLQTTDPTVAKAFYAELCGWRDEVWGAGDAGVTLWRMPGYVGGEPQQPVPRDVVAVMLPIEGERASGSYWGVDFWIDDADLAAAKAPQLGGRIVTPPHDIPGFRNAVLADPHGAVFSVSTLALGG